MVEVGTGSLDTLRFIRTLHKKMETHAASIMKKERERDGQNFDARKVENVSSFLGRLVLPTAVPACHPYPYLAVKKKRKRFHAWTVAASLSILTSSLAMGCTWQRQWHLAFCSSAEADVHWTLPMDR